MKKGNERSWQIDEHSIETDHAQLWSASGIMLTAQVTNAEAREMVREGRAFVISAQAIGLYDKEGG